MFVSSDSLSESHFCPSVELRFGDVDVRVVVCGDINSLFNEALELVEKPPRKMHAGVL